MKYTEKKKVFIPHKLEYNARIFQNKPHRRGGIHS